MTAYNDQTAPLLPYYERQNKLVEVDGMGSIEAVAAAIDDALDGPQGLSWSRRAPKALSDGVR